ncbi:uncharacterized protein LOC131639664 [Vicia villosa]|uniref:uncharacterized protein LOC131639664 n=1 Tax=Vicia villosa TaxID=3911 RepID=UPI00273CC3D4|nr:uncharacterized protein LOC131639664 [Vicia villosa]
MTSIGLAPNSKVSEYGFWQNEVWHWNLKYNQYVLIGEMLVEWMELHNIIVHISLIPILVNKFAWWQDENIFSVKAAYHRLNVIVGVDYHIEEQLSMILKIMRKSHVPSNIQIFIWRLLLNRLPTRDELAKCGIIRSIHDLSIPLCFGTAEFHLHLFLLCIVEAVSGLYYTIGSALKVLISLQDCWLI